MKTLLAALVIVLIPIQAPAYWMCDSITENDKQRLADWKRINSHVELDYQIKDLEQSIARCEKAQATPPPPFQYPSIRYEESGQKRYKDYTQEYVDKLRAQSEAQERNLQRYQAQSQQFFSNDSRQAATEQRLRDLEAATEQRLLDMEHQVRAAKRKADDAYYFPDPYRYSR